jgi:predicted GIY-YIG superfamily endonuclease
MSINDIIKYVDLTKSTISNYAYKFADLLERAKQYFGEKVQDFVQKVKAKTTAQTPITYECEYKVGNCAYIIEYFNSKKEFIFLKVGMTNNITRRIKEHLKAYTEEFDSMYAVVKRLYYTKEDDDALTMENTLRKHYKHQENNGFLPRDRFLYCRYDKEDIESDNLITTQYNLCCS